MSKYEMFADDPVRLFESLWTRKPSDWGDAATLRVASMPDAVRKWLLTLPKHYISDSHHPLKDFPADHPIVEGGKPPRYFILDTFKNQYLVNTEGYNYCRYIVRLRAL